MPQSVEIDYPKALTKIITKMLPAPMLAAHPELNALVVQAREVLSAPAPDAAVCKSLVEQICTTRK